MLVTASKRHVNKQISCTSIGKPCLVYVKTFHTQASPVAFPQQIPKGTIQDAVARVPCPPNCLECHFMVFQNGNSVFLGDTSV